MHCSLDSIRGINHFREKLYRFITGAQAPPIISRSQTLSNALVEKTSIPDWLLMTKQSMIIVVGRRITPMIISERVSNNM